jgi:hypothetical protein
MKTKHFNMICLFFATLLISFYVANRTEAVPPAALDGMFIINEDAWHFYYTRQPEQMTLEALNAFVDQYAETKLTHLFLNPNAQRSRFRSQTREASWDDQVGLKEFWSQNPKLLYERGLDPYKIWIERCREKKISPWISMRMNDTHCVQWIDHFQHSKFWKNNPSFWRDPNDKSGSWSLRALNYAHPEVQEYQISFVRELFERYDFDGFEVDWMRFGWHLTPGKEKEESILLNKFMQNVRKIAREWEQKRGHPIYIATRVPYDPDAAATYGMDALQWAREGSIDLVIPMPRWVTDFDIPIECWRERLDADGGHSANVAIASGMDAFTQASPGGKQVMNDLANLYGFVASNRWRGSRNIYLFNWFDPTPTIFLEWSGIPAGAKTSSLCPVSEKDYRTLLEKGIGDDVILHSVRRHPISYHQIIDDNLPDGIKPHSDGLNINVQLPQTPNPESQFTIPLGAKPVTGKFWLILGLAANESVKESVFSVTLNGKNVKQVDDAELKGLSGDVVRALRFDCPLDTAKDGTNNVIVSQNSGTPQKIVWVELKIEPDRK